MPTATPTPEQTFGRTYPSHSCCILNNVSLLNQLQPCRLTTAETEQWNLHLDGENLRAWWTEAIRHQQFEFDQD